MVLDGVRVLLVEDDFDSREVYTILLEQHGATVDAAEDVAGALELFGRARPDVLLVDLWLGTRWDGLELLAEIRSHPEEAAWPTPALALTAMAPVSESARAALSRFDAFREKPCAFDELVELVAALAARRGDLAREGGRD